MASKRTDSGKNLVDPPSIPPTFRVQTSPETKELSIEPVADTSTVVDAAPVPKDMFDFSEDDGSEPHDDGVTPDIAPPQLLDPPKLVVKPSLARSAPPPKKKGAEPEPKPAPKAKAKPAPVEAAVSAEKEQPVAASPTEPPAESAPRKKGRLAARARRPVSAQQALEAAKGAPTSPEPTEKAAPAKKTKAASTASPPPKKTASKSPEPAPAAAEAAPMVPEDPTAAATAAIKSLFGSATIARILPIRERRVFRALWLAHRVRGLSEGNAQLAITANLLLDALDRVPDQGLAAAEISAGDETFAVYIDLTRSVVIAMAQPASVYLAGL